jgi:hypothetical protein
MHRMPDKIKAKVVKRMPKANQANNKKASAKKSGQSQMKQTRGAQQKTTGKNG